MLERSAAGIMVSDLGAEPYLAANVAIAKSQNEPPVVLPRRNPALILA
jgi:hypothetical protein